MSNVVNDAAVDSTNYEDDVYSTNVNGDAFDDNDVIAKFLDENDSTEEDESFFNSDISTLVERNDYRPVVLDDFKPKINMIFESLDLAMKMYSNYAEMGGFDVRKNGQRKNGFGIIQHKYLVCHRNGKGRKRSYDTLESSSKKKRNSHFKVTNCNAKIKFVRVVGSNYYRVELFDELHNHPLEDRSQLRKSRKVSFSEQEFLVRASTAKIGATMAHKLRASLKGGYQHVKSKVADYKNFERDIRSCIGYRDAQMIVDKMIDRKEYYPNYSFEYRCEKSVLNAMFWADERNKAYYSEFGDVISFDATFRTNKYGMVFVPFTVIDHHKRSVVVGAGLLSTETIDSYRWLLQAFLNAHGKQSVLVLTDQDPAIKQAVESVFLLSKHRLCMWHIMKKLQGKVCMDIFKNTDFRKRFNKLIWNVHIEPDEFEVKWNLLIEEFKLQDTRWFNDMFTFRKSWIPAFFKNMPMCGLMKTTSRSESINSFFNTYSKTGNLLLRFMMNYDAAIEKQRNSQEELDHKTKIAKYSFKSPLPIEKHASTLYTSTIFFEIQRELYKAAWFCEDVDFKFEDGWEIYTVIHKNQATDVKYQYKVEVKFPEENIKCSCDRFNRIGILCRHAFRIMMKKDMKEIPEQYIVRRWRKDVISKNYKLSGDWYNERDGETTKLVNEAFFMLESCLDSVRDNKQNLGLFVTKMKEVFEEYQNECIDKVQNEKNERVEQFMGVSIPKEISINVPELQRNKGCGTKRRIVGEAEKAIESSKKQHRMCSGCGLHVPHNYRTCPVRLAAKKPKE